MKIVLVSSFDERTPATYLLNSFREKGINVLTIGTKETDYVDVVKNRTFKLRTILKQKNFNPDLLIYVEGGSTPIFPMDMDQLNFPTVWWGIDTHNDYELHLMISRIFDHSLIAQKCFVDRLSEDGIRSVTWLPLATPTFKIDKAAKSETYDIAYVGSMNWDLYPEREKVYETIKANFTNFYFGTASPEQMMKIYSRSKIVINHSLMNDVNMRIFESLGAGSLLLTNKIHNNGLEDLLTREINFDTYENLEDLLEKINFYLQNERIRKKIADEGYAEVLKFHTYSNRVDFILEKEFNVSNHAQVRIVDLMNALIFMKYLKESFGLFVFGFGENLKGKRYKFIYKIFLFFAKPLIMFLRFLSYFVFNFRKRK
jgi:glycosyltransferase involved in cell wall biosynthesis